MNKKITHLTTLLYAVLFGSLVAAISGSLGIGLVFAALTYYVGRKHRLPKGAFGSGAPEPEVKSVEDLTKDIAKKMGEWKELIAKKGDQSSIEALKLELEELRQEKKDAEIESLKALFEAQEEIIKKQGESITALKEKTVSPSSSDLAVELKANMEEFKLMAKHQSAKEIQVKALVLRSAITNNENAYDLPDIGQLATRKLSMYDIFPKLRIGKGSHNGTIRYYDWDEDTIARAAAAVAEGAAFPESTAKWKKGSITIQKVGDTIPVTEEFFEDEEMFAAEIGAFLTTNVNLEVDRQIALGDGTGNTLTGLLASISAYVPVASAIQDASIYDLIPVVKTSITTVGGSKYNPDVVIMNPADILKYKLKKDQNDNYVLPPFVSKDGTVIDNVMVIESAIMTADTLVIGDRRYARIYEMPGMEISKGYVNTQFTEDEMTLKIRKRMAFLIRGADAGGFRKVVGIDAALVTLAS
jgi:HK97 family phage major capsid protein